MTDIAIAWAAVVGYMLIAGLIWTLVMNGEEDAIVLALIWPLLLAVAVPMTLVIGPFVLPNWIKSRRKERP